MESLRIVNMFLFIVRNIIAFAFVLFTFLFSQDSVQIHHIDQDNKVKGFLTFDWSGHRGIYHQYGFPGWGIDIHENFLFFDGNFAHWYKRYTFPFQKQSIEKEDESGVQSSIWYRTGDYFLDEFAFDVTFSGESNQTISLQALKRSFEDQYGLLGPKGFPGGTIQQNYHLLLRFPDEEDREWQLSTAYFKTTDGIETQTDLGWEKGASRLDRILTNQLSYRTQKNRVNYYLKANAFSQRLKTTSITEVPEWEMDLISYKVFTSLTYPSTTGDLLYLEGWGKYSAITSDSLGNLSRVIFSGMGGFQKTFRNFVHRLRLGLGFLFPDRPAFIFNSISSYSMKSVEFVFTIDQFLHSLPFQYSGNIVNWFDVSSSTWFWEVYPDTSALSQKRTVGKASIIHSSISKSVELGIFASSNDPHYFFEKQKSFFTEVPDRILLRRRNSDSIQGLFWSGKINYFRNWWLQGNGISLFENKRGWGNGVQHEGTINLLFQESLFQKRMDLYLNLWTNLWIGRSQFVWDPLLSFGYYDTNIVFPQETSGLLNFEIKGVISSLEISYRMVNVLYAGRSLIRNLFGDSITEDQLTFNATPLLPSMGRLSFIAIKWNFKD